MEPQAEEATSTMLAVCTKRTVLRAGAEKGSAKLGLLGVGESVSILEEGTCSAG
eukprot:COSAG01_NODE_3493_length_6010_cov_378.882592_1_plen_53_part_10